MTPKEIIEGNKLIAKFMGYGQDEFENITSKNIPILKVSELKYHNDWASLMDVVEKIAKNFDVRITWMPTAINVTYIDRPDLFDGEITSIGGLSAKENTWFTVVEFIKWYNKIKI